MASATPQRMTLAASMYLFHHVFLPPKLPQADDYDAEYETILLDRVCDALRDFSSHVPSPDAGIITAAMSMTNRVRAISESKGEVNERQLKEALQKLDTEGGFLPIHVRDQNAAILLTATENAINVESFELSPRNGDVMSTVGRLQRVFPGPTLAFDRSTFSDPRFLKAISQTVARMSNQAAPDTLMKVKKAGQMHNEDRDTTHPKMVTEFIMAILRPRSTDVSALQILKNTREEILWSNCRSPWRRTALWLMVRVKLQLIFYRERESDDLYKSFMVFFMTSIIKLSSLEMTSENLYLMNAKVARRLLKLGLSDEPSWFKPVQQSLRQTNDTITTRWQESMQRENQPDMQSLKGLNFTQDIYHELPNLDYHVKSIRDRRNVRNPASPKYQPQLKLHLYKATELPVLNMTDAEYRIFNLAAMEDWVAVNLDRWLGDHGAKEDTCGRLRELMTAYHNSASPLYSKNPEALSVMILTLLELWIACDKSAIRLHELLSEYDPGVPRSIFQSLLLPFKSQMDRLARAEEYLHQRGSAVRCPGSSPFRDFGTKSCFSVRYFEQSDSHQRLLETIEKQATRERMEKKSELLEKQQKYTQLKELADKTDCKYVEIVLDAQLDIRESRHSSACARCKYEAEANGISISVHEWPLSANALQAKSTVFELRVPRPFGDWREATVFFISKALGYQYSAIGSPRATYKPNTYQGLCVYFVAFKGCQRIGLLSQEKPHETTHRKNQRIINVDVSDICLSNGLHFRYFDNERGCFVEDFQPTLKLAKMCTYQLPQESASLQQFLFRPANEPNGPPPNTVIASQFAAPRNFSLEEYKSLATMPLGMKVQWQNIMLELSTSAVDFKKVETVIFILQIINQAGPPQSHAKMREGHTVLSDENFAFALLDRIQEAKEKMKENWALTQGLCALICLVTRISSLSSSPDIQSLCLHHLMELRHIAFHWVSLVRDEINQATESKHKTLLIARNFHIALVCVETFNVEDLIPIFARPLDVSIYIQCCMMIHNWKSFSCMKTDPVIPVLYHRWQNLTYRSHPMLVDKVVIQHDPGLDMAIKEAWAAYIPHTSWSKVFNDCDYWLTTCTAPQSAHDTGMLVHLNLVTGELLVNGLPLARLPSNYEQDRAYQSLFGKSQLEVMPSDIPGMQFSCRNQFMAHTVHLGLDRDDLLVRAAEGERVWELVPSRLFTGLLPENFVESFTHWYSVNDGYVEFRPAITPWLSSKFNWRLRKSQSRTDWYLARNGTYLASLTSRTAKLLSEIFDPVEKASRLHCILHWRAQAVEVEIPRLRLEFVLQAKCSLIKSRQYPGMSVDTNQSLDTLIGLRNRILLVKNNAQDRVLLIPEGDVMWEKNGDHVDVKIPWKLETNLHAYNIDNELGRVIDNGSLHSKLFLSYLHALTSFCLPDPLLKKTGTEQALSILRCASVRSFDKLALEHVYLLERIALLTPGRRYYPANERVMQEVHWQPHLSSLSHHYGFYEEVKAILDQDRRMGLFNPLKKTYSLSGPHVEDALLQRDKIRISSFRVSGFGGEDHSQEHDSRYKGLDRIRETTNGLQVFTICKMIYDQIPSVRNNEADWLLSHIWKYLLRAPQVHGPNVQVDVAGIRYDAKLIQEPGTFVASHWCGIHRLLCSNDPLLDMFQVMIWLSTMAFSQCADMEVLEVLASLFIMPEAASVLAPSLASFRPSLGYKLDKNVLRSQIRGMYRVRTPVSRFVREARETTQQFNLRKSSTLSRNRSLALKKIIDHLEHQWDNQTFSNPVPDNDPKVADYLNVQEAMNYARDRFTNWRDNEELRQYLARIVALLGDETTQPVKMPRYAYPDNIVHVQQKSRSVRLEDVLLHPPNLEITRPNLQDFGSTFLPSKLPKHRITGLVETLALQAKSGYEKWYIDQLRSSATSLQKTERATNLGLMMNDLKESITDYNILCQEYADRIYTMILSEISQPSTTARGPRESMRVKVLATLAAVNQWPRVSPLHLLEQLSRNKWHRLPIGWKRALIMYGCSITALQRAKRLAGLTEKHDEFSKELENPGHTNWDPIDYPESLLLEIENGILIRDVQEDIARQMRQFGPGENAVMQLNMGEGKSSVIVPIVATALASGSCLVRVIVAKPQSRQMFQMLVSKLGGLLGRRVYHMPVSRSLKLGQEEADEIERMCRECMKQGGILLVQPEHILSLNLMCIECFISGREAVGHSLLRTLKFFREFSRDVVDESDENFNVKFELIYTMGTQRPVEFSPQRWVIVHQVLDLVRTYALEVKEAFPRSIEVEEQESGGFPRLRLLNRDAENELLSRIARHICDYGIGALPISRQPHGVRRAVLTYLTKNELTKEEIAAVESEGSTGFWTEITKEPLLLLRGLLAGGVLAFCLTQKRWRVNYGLDPIRDPPKNLCVPYRAKDNPSLRSEFSHPDVVLILTSLNYYFSGLNDGDLRMAFLNLIKSDQADIEYQEWVKDASSLPQVYRQLVGVNLEDQQQCAARIFPALRFSKPAIDYFLAHIVFPKEIKEFPDKLSASGWDIGEVKDHPTVGFSGTNDSRKTLPLSVQQLDLPEQNHTNALVLEYLLRPENSVVSIPDSHTPAQSDAQRLLDLVSSLDPSAQVILDVGAQILELSNIQVAKRWLEMLPKNGLIHGVVFINDNDEIVVLDRMNRVELLQISPFARQMEACFVFLDEAHTRGIDLKLPTNYRAAVTLGPGITKDKLVQACMRMRKLGNGHSVVFCVPPEIRFKIMGLRGKNSSSEVNVSDVLCWAVSETWIEIRRSVPLWAVQGRRFERQRKIWSNAHYQNSGAVISSHAKDFLEPECQSLEQRYRPGAGHTMTICGKSDVNENLQLIEERCREFDNPSFASAALQEEQERELAPEVERERDVERPPATSPQKHQVHPDLYDFVATGRINPDSGAYEPAFKSLKHTTAAYCLSLSVFPSNLVVTKDFAITVLPFRGSKITANAFQRPVRWILTSHKCDASSGKRVVTEMMIISPFEAQNVIDHVKRSKIVTLHVYAPRQNRSFPSLDRLILYNVSKEPGEIEVPEILRLLLNLFAGQLYLESYSEYKRLCEFLGVASEKTSEGLVVAADGFILQGGRKSKTPFQQSPLKFLRILLSEIRKDCRDIDRTHLGRIVNGRLLHPSDFEDTPGKSGFEMDYGRLVH